MKTRYISALLCVLGLIAALSAEPNGAVLILNDTRIGHKNVPGNAQHHYFGYLEGPAWENKYCAYRFYIDGDDRNALDIMGKYKPGAILQDFKSSNDDPHNAWSWGSDILKVGSSMGVGAFRLWINGQWVKPQIPETLDSLVVTIVDSSVQTPEVLVAYYGWNIGSGSKIDALWTITTTLEERMTHCELAIVGEYSGKVVVGMVNHSQGDNPNRNTVSIIKDAKKPLLATLGKQSSKTEGFDDSLLMAIVVDSAYFSDFNDEGTTNVGMVLNPDNDNKVRWSFTTSWAKEEDPLFRHDDWKEKLFPSTAIEKPVVYRQPAGAVIAGNGASFHPVTTFSLDGRLIGSARNGVPVQGRSASGATVTFGKGMNRAVLKTTVGE